MAVFDVIGVAEADHQLRNAQPFAFLAVEAAGHIELAAAVVRGVEFRLKSGLRAEAVDGHPPEDPGHQMVHSRKLHHPANGLGILFGHPAEALVEKCRRLGLFHAHALERLVKRHAGVDLLHGVGADGLGLVLILVAELVEPGPGIFEDQRFFAFSEFFRENRLDIRKNGGFLLHFVLTSFLCFLRSESSKA